MFDVVCAAAGKLKSRQIKHKPRMIRVILIALTSDYFSESGFLNGIGNNSLSQPQPVFPG